MPRQFKSTDTSLWSEQFGTGKDGSLTITTGTVFNVNSSPFTTNANAFGTFTGTSGNSSGTATDAYGFYTDYVFVGDYVLIHQTQGTNVGNWELNVVTGGIPAGAGSSTLTLKYPLQNTYTTGCQIVKCPQFTNINFNSGTNISQKAWDSFKWGGIIAFFCSGKTTIAGNLYTGTTGFQGGAGRDLGSQSFQGENENNTGVQSSSASYNGGGGSDGDNGGGRGASGGGGGNYTTGGAGGTEGGSATGGGGGTVAQTNNELTVSVFGGGGGGGSRTGSSIPYPAGGTGGGLIFIFSKEIEVTGGLTSEGSAGQTSGDGGGGGGAGGCILIKSITATLGTNITTTLGGAGGIRGGTGGTGRIHLDYASSYTGTTNPTLSATQDSSLYPSGGSFIFNML
jgi:hypothetical protein